MEILAATQNPGKLQELHQLLPPLGITVLTPVDVGLGDLDVAETGETFEENACLKAEAFGRASGKMSLADDSGLGVAALGGEPGVHSKRIGRTDQERNMLILDKVSKEGDRSAWFISVLALYDPATDSTKTFEGKIAGRIAKSPNGDKKSGFGYDPIFIPDGYLETFAELGPEIKNKISHRAIALRLLQQYLTTL